MPPVAPNAIPTLPNKGQQPPQKPPGQQQPSQQQVAAFNPLRDMPGEQYLVSKGWLKLNDSEDPKKIFWKDPTGSNDPGKVTRVREFEGRDNKKEVLEQLVVGRDPNWRHRTEEALDIQLARDKEVWVKQQETIAK